MKKILGICFINILYVSFVFSQSGDHLGGGFSKTIEYNLLWWGNGYNLSSKEDIEKLFFGDFKAPVEFFSNPSLSNEPEVPSGFRIIKDTLKKNYILEIKWIPNFREALKDAYSNCVSSPVSTPKDTLDQITIQKNAYELALKLFTVDTRTVSISNSFAEKMCNMYVSSINNVKARGVPRHIVDGEVVDDEVTPSSEDELKMFIICSKIIEDGKNNQFDEASYTKLLDDF